MILIKNTIRKFFILLPLIFMCFTTRAQEQELSLGGLVKNIGKASSGIATYLRGQGYRYNRLDGNNPCTIYANNSKLEFTICEKSALAVYFSFNVSNTSIELYKKELEVLKFKAIKTEQVEGKLPQQEYVSADSKVKVLMQWDKDTNNLYIDVVLAKMPSSE